MKRSSLLRTAVAAVFALAAGAGAAHAVSASISLAPTLSALPNIGKVIQSIPTGTGTFRVDAATGNVSVQSGTLTRIGGASVSVTNYTVTCKNGSGGNNACGASVANVTVTFSNLGTALAAKVAAFNVSVTPGPGGANCTVLMQNTATASFKCGVVKGAAGLGKVETVATFTLGMDISILSVATTGPQSPPYMITTTP